MRVYGKSRSSKSEVQDVANIVKSELVASVLGSSSALMDAGKAQHAEERPTGLLKSSQSSSSSVLGKRKVHDLEDQKSKTIVSQLQRKANVFLESSSDTIPQPVEVKVRKWKEKTTARFPIVSCLVSIHLSLFMTNHRNPVYFFFPSISSFCSWFFFFFHQFL